MSKKNIAPSILDTLQVKKQDEQSDLSKATELLLNEKWRRRKTNIRSRSSSALSTIDTIAQLYDVTFLKQWVDAYTEYVTSVDGKGRQDIVDITKFSIERQDQRQKELMEVLGRR